MPVRLTHPIAAVLIRRSLLGPELFGPDRGATFETAGPLRVLAAVRDDGRQGTLREVQLDSGEVCLVHEDTLTSALPRRAPQQIARRQMVAGRSSGGF